MTSYRPVHESGDIGGPGLKGGDYYSTGFWAQNGCSMHADGSASSRPNATTPAMPKMGVRARIADWPPKREGMKDPSTSRDLETPTSVPRGFQNGQFPSGITFSSGVRGFQRLVRRRSKDTEFQDGWPRSPGRGFLPLRNRSSSEITLSECDMEEAFEPRGVRLSSGLPLFREYGSTSSIDVQGISEQSFYEMLNEFRSGTSVDQQQPPPPPDSFRTSRSAKAEARNDQDEYPLHHKEKSRKKGSKGEAGGGDSIFRKLRNVRGDGESSKALVDAEEGVRPWLCQKSFAHYDVQSMLFDLNEVVGRRAYVAQRRNTTTGASAASAGSTTASRSCGLTGLEPPPSFISTEDLNYKENLDHDPGDNNSNDLLLSCPHFRNEIGGEQERNVGFSQASAGSPSGGSCGEGSFAEVSPATYCTNASLSVLEVPKELQRNISRLKHYSIEHVDLGAHYYQDYFCGKEHSNYFGVDEKLGPVAVSIRREKLEDHREHGPQYQYRIIFRTSELITLRGSILEDATPTATKHGTIRGLPLKDALEYVVPELNIHCLRLALNVPKVTEQLRKLDEQGLCRKHKVGILYCKANQSSEEEMYNNEEAGPAFEEFLALLGEKVCLRGFSKYAAQLDTKTDSTGTHSLYTTYQGYEVMFHVSTMLPYTPNNRQQLLRKRHIGNDIVTIIFQEPGAQPFTPQNIRSHFQHVFVIVRVQNPCTENVCYSVAVTRSKDVPPFGPAIPSRVVFRKSDVFRDFLLAKVINAENAAYKSDKFHTMATRTRQEYLKDLAENSVTSTPIDSTGKFNLISLTSKKKEKTKARIGAEQYSTGAIAWRVLAQDYSQGMEIEAVLGISNEFIVLLDLSAEEVVFNCFCADVIGWTPDNYSIKIFYGRGDHIFIRAIDGNSEDIKEIVQRLKVMTSGCETIEMTLRRNGLGQLGFHVKFDGTVAEVEDYGFAWQAGLRQGSRLVEICKVAVVTLSHDQMIDWLRTSVTVKVVIIPPHDDGTPRRGWAESFKMSTMEPKMEPESLPVGYRPPYRSNSTWQWSGSATHGSSQSSKWAEQPASGQSQSLTRTPKQSTMAPYRESQLPHGKRPVSFPETPHAASTSQGETERMQAYRQPSSSFSVPSSSGAAYNRFKPSPESSIHRYGGPQRSLMPFESLYAHEVTSNGGDSSSSGLASQESTMEKPKPEPLWHVPVQPRIPAASGSKRTSRHEMAGKDSPNRHAKGEGQYSSSHSSSNTLSSNASSSHSDERWFDTPDPVEADPDPLAKGGSSDSGIDANSAMSSRREKLPKSSPPFGSTHQEASSKRKEPSSGQGWGYRTKGFGMGSGMPARGTSSSINEHLKQSSHNNSNSRATYPAHIYKNSTAEATRAPHMSQSSSFQLSASVPKSFFSKQSSRNKHLPAGWKKNNEDTPARPVTFTDPKKQVDLSTKNVFGQPRLRASLRDLRSPRKTYKSSIEDDLKKLIIMDSSVVEQERDLVSEGPHRRHSREPSQTSLCSGRRDATYASAYCFEQPLSSDVLFTSTYPSSTLPVRKQQQQQQHQSPSNGNLSEKKSNISASELSLSDARDKSVRRIDPGLMPLPDTATGLEWSSLVSAAKAYEVQRAVSLFSLNDAVLSPDVPSAHSPVLGHLSLERQPTPRTTPTMSEEPSADLTGKVYQLEAMLKQLHTDLQKEKQDKVVLQAEVANLRQNNQRLQEESQTANDQLRKFAEIFSNAVEKKEL